MILFTAKNRCAVAFSDNPITTGSAGIPVKFQFSSDWNGLAKIATFRCGDLAADVALTADEIPLPPDVLVNPGELLKIGVYGALQDGTIIMPTVWAKVEHIKLGALPSGVDPSEPTPSWVAQVQQIAAEALETAEAVQTAAERGDFDGADGVSPEVTITTIEGGHRVTITDAAHPTGQSFDVMDGAGGGSDDVFYADYGTTTSAEIEAAYQAGQACFCKLDTGTVLQLFYPYSAAYHVFSAAYNDTIYIAVCNNSSWSKVTRQLAKASDIPTVASDVGAIADPSTKSSGQVLTFDGSSWVAATPSGGGAVESVNGQTGAVVLTAADVGAGTYSKPSGGIPASDLAPGVIPAAASSGTPAMDGTAARGSSAQFARADHVHPTDTSRAAVSDLAAKITAPSSPATGAFLVWDGSAWTAQTLATWQGGNY